MPLASEIVVFTVSGRVVLAKPYLAPGLGRSLHPDGPSTSKSLQDGLSRPLFQSSVPLLLTSRSGSPPGSGALEAVGSPIQPGRRKGGVSCRSSRPRHRTTELPSWLRHRHRPADVSTPS